MQWWSALISGRPDHDTDIACSMHNVPEPNSRAGTPFLSSSTRARSPVKEPDTVVSPSKNTRLQHLQTSRHNSRLCQEKNYNFIVIYIELPKTLIFSLLSFYIQFCFHQDITKLYLLYHFILNFLLSTLTLLSCLSTVYALASYYY